MTTNPTPLKEKARKHRTARLCLLATCVLAGPALALGQTQAGTTHQLQPKSEIQLSEFDRQLGELRHLADKGLEEEAMQSLDRLSRSANPAQLLQMVNLVLDRRSPLHDPQLGTQMVDFLTRQDTPLNGEAALELARYFASSIYLDDMEIAISWARQALVYGEQDAHGLLGDLYSKSVPALRDLNLALLHYRQFAAHSSVAPLISFARMIHRTAVTPKECNIDALELIGELLPRLKLEAHSGKAAAQKELGRLFWHGVTVARDRGLALGWFQKAAQNGDAGAKSELAKISLETSGETRLDFLKAAAEQGNRRAVSLLVRILLNRNTTASDREAVELIQAAIATGNLADMQKLNATYETELLLGSNIERIQLLKEGIEEIEQQIASLYPGTTLVARGPTPLNTYGLDETIVGSVESLLPNSTAPENTTAKACSQPAEADYPSSLGHLLRD